MTGIILKDVPISARYEVDNKTGEMRMVSAEYADVPADLVAKLLIEGFGMDAIFGEGS